MNLQPHQSHGRGREIAASGCNLHGLYQYAFSAEGVDRESGCSKIRPEDFHTLNVTGTPTETFTPNVTATETPTTGQTDDEDSGEDLIGP